MGKGEVKGFGEIEEASKDNYSAKGRESWEGSEKLG